MKEIAKQVGIIAQEFDEEMDPMAAAQLVQQRLFSYSDSIASWARDVANVMLKRADQADYDTWLRVGKDISSETKQRLNSPSIGREFDRMQSEQINLIQSIPQVAAEKVQDWVKAGLSEGKRPIEIANRIQNDLAGVTESRAVCIARTETARARTNFTRARAMAVGSTGYIWRTVGDGAVRKTHAKLNGTVQRWDSPPLVEKGIRAHPGTIWNCRCYASPIFPKENEK